MARAREMQDHNEIRRWAEAKGGRPGQVQGTDAMLRIDFGKPEERLQSIDWERFLELFDRGGVRFLYDPDGHMNKSVRDSYEECRLLTDTL